MFYFEFIKFINNLKKKKLYLLMLINIIVILKRVDFDWKSKIYNKNLDLKLMFELLNFS